MLPRKCSVNYSQRGVRPVAIEYVTDGLKESPQDQAVARRIVLGCFKKLLGARVRRLRRELNHTATSAIPRHNHPP